MAKRELNAKVGGRAPAALTDAIRILWSMRPPRPRNLLACPAFVHLRDVCIALYPNLGHEDILARALSTALRRLGLPIYLTRTNEGLRLTPEVAAAQLDNAFLREFTTRRYLCPMDGAGDLPPVRFGGNTIGTLSAAELEALIDAPGLRRFNPSWVFNAKYFSRFCWLAVAETVAVEQDPGTRRHPEFYRPAQDWYRIEPHASPFPEAVQDALFVMMLVPWEEWNFVEGKSDIYGQPGEDLCGFRVPWIYEYDEDIFTRRHRPPTPDTLRPKPKDYYLDQVVWIPSEISEWLDDRLWFASLRALRSPLFETPVTHFLIRGFLEHGIDEFLAHLMTIEAALGLRSDYPGATQRVAKRVSALLGAASDGAAYERLFDLRSAYLHGRRMGDISSSDRLLARQLARRAVLALTVTANSIPDSQTREQYLRSLK